METYKHGLTEATDWLVLLSLLMVLALTISETVFDTDSKDFILPIDTVGTWRCSVGGVHLLRGVPFLHVVYPYYCRRARQSGGVADPPHVFLMVTSFRIDALITAMAYRLVIRETIDNDYPTTMVCPIVEMSDEILARSLQEKMNPPDRISLNFVRIPGTGKRDGLTYGFRMISRHLPDNGAVVAVIDGDTVLSHGVVKRTVPWLRLFSDVDGLITNEFCEVQGSYVMSEQHKLRFAQRHINMCSMALSKHVLTMTGWTSVFRTRVVTNPEFITDVENDHLKHWRLGRFKSLTGDDGSSWLSLMRLDYDAFYVLDATINMVEHPPEGGFIKASRKPMCRWHGNNLRQNPCALKLGAQRLGQFTMPVLFGQRVSVWTSLPDLTVAIFASLKYSIAFLLVYLLWIGPTRLVLTPLLLLSGRRTGPAYLLILYYNQIVGALVKVYVLFHLDRQSWIRQPTKLGRGLASFQRQLNAQLSRAMIFPAASILIAVLLTIIQPPNRLQIMPGSWPAHKSTQIGPSRTRHHEYSHRY